MGKLISLGATIVLVICAVIITTLVVRRELGVAGRSAPASQIRVLSDKEWKAVVSSGTVIGRSNAQLRLVEFADFQCPFCGRAQTTLKQLRNLDDFALVFVHFPLEGIHPQAFNAAVASECAANEGFFESYHDLLCEQQDSLGALPWAALARQVGITDTGEFERCMVGRQTEDLVRRNMVLGKSLGVRGTPTFVFDKRVFVETDSLARLEFLIERAQDSLEEREQSLQKRQTPDDVR